MWRITKKATLGLAALLLLGMVGCTELEVTNPNAPDAERALATTGDVESLIAGGFDSWHETLWYNGPTMALSAASFEHTAPWANAGMEFYARIPRVPVANVSGGRDVGNLTFAFERSYRAINAIASGLYSVDAGDVDLGDDALRASAYSKFIQGIAHGTVALLYDSGFVFDETAACLQTATCGATVEAALLGYQDVADAALGYLYEAASLANGASFTLPSTWMGRTVPAATLEQLAYSEAARLRAAVARTPAERQAVDWDQIVTDAGRGVTTDWNFINDCVTFCDDAFYYRNYPSWHMMPMWVIGMADQSGAYQNWINTPTTDKQPFVMVTPDTRFPQGATEAEQLAAEGEYFYVNSSWYRVWSRPDRGTWRWSYYDRVNYVDMSFDWEGDFPLWTARELDALVAEAAYYDGDMAAVADYVNASRTLHGLAATDAGGTNADCVPKLPNGSCGNLLEMFKWEKRLETHFLGPLRIGWYFDGRGWGDLMEGTVLQFPTPYGEIQLLEGQPYNFGGAGGNSSAPVGTYGY